MANGFAILYSYPLDLPTLPSYHSMNFHRDIQVVTNQRVKDDVKDRNASQAINLDQGM